MADYICVLLLKISHEIVEKIIRMIYVMCG